jgi:type IV secretion system protein VirB9
LVEGDELMRASAATLALLAATSLAGCAALNGKPEPQVAKVVAAPPAPPPPVTRPPLIVASTPVPNPPERATRGAHRALPAESVDPMVRVARANAAARVEPSRDGYANAAQVYRFSDGALFQVYAAPGQVTDIALQEGESLSGTGPVAAGDTTRWVIGDTESGAGASRRVHILVKPTRANLQTNLVVNTDRRTYHIELRATPATYMASVAWSYPDDEMRAAAASAAVEQFAIPSVAVENLNFAYRIEGAKPAWRPVRVFDDGRQTFIEFPASISRSEMPPLFINAGRGRDGQLVNYRVKGERMIVDRLFDAAELRLGDRGGQQIVRIERTARR